MPSTSRDEVKNIGGKMIRGCWIRSNKGDPPCPDYRSRFVGKEFNVGADPELYAATPPLEAVELLLGHASANKRRGIYLMFSDAKRAYFNALAQRELWVDLPENVKSTDQESSAVWRWHCMGLVTRPCCGKSAWPSI